MNTITNIQNTLGKTWHSISDGWQHFYQRCKGALTHFDANNEQSVKKDERRLSWGLLNTDLADHEKNLTVTMEIPGLEKSDIDIDINGNTLTVSGTKRFEEERHEGEYHIMECAYGSFQRSFTLPARVNETEIDATYKNGVLHLSIPKLTETKKLEIKED
jgi:HSP20 family protein